MRASWRPPKANVTHDEQRGRLSMQKTDLGDLRASGAAHEDGADAEEDCGDGKGGQEGGMRGAATADIRPIVDRVRGGCVASVTQRQAHQCLNERHCQQRGGCACRVV